MDAFTFKLVFEPAFENVDQLELDVVMVFLALVIGKWICHADH